jgi:hypothetical protein
MGKKINNKSVKQELDIQTKRFSEFRGGNLHLTKEITDVYDAILNEFNAFIVGSDVVWKPEIVGCIDREIYFLRSVPASAIKMAYAASIGTDDKAILEKYDSAYREAFDSLDYISVREQSMVNFVRQYTDQSVVSVIDPIFLLTPEDYQPIENNTQTLVNGKEYVYVYLLSRNETALAEANTLAQKKGLHILLDISEGFEDAKRLTVPFESAISAGPAEFLYNIRHASYVITDSFHATAFSILYNITFWVFRRGKISVRMTDLTERFSVCSRMYEGNITTDPIDWKAINEKIAEERSRGITYLMTGLKGKRDEAG